MCGPKYVFKIMYVSIISVYTVHDCQENKYMKYIWFEQNTDAEWIYLFFIFFNAIFSTSRLNRLLLFTRTYTFNLNTDIIYDW